MSFSGGDKNALRGGRLQCLLIRGAVAVGLMCGAPIYAQDSDSKVPAASASGAAQELQAQESQSADEEKQPAPDYSLKSVLRQLSVNTEQAQGRLLERERQFQAQLEQAQSELQEAQETLAAMEAHGRRLESRFESNKVELSDKDTLLKDKIGALKELFGVFQQNASDLIGAFTTSPTSLQYPDRDVWLEGFANRMKNASEVTSADDIKLLWFELQREIAARGEIVRLPATVVDLRGMEYERDVVRVGGFDLLTADPTPRYLSWRAGRQQVSEIPRQPTGSYASEIAAYLAADVELRTLSVDPTGGELMSLLAEKPTLRERIDQGGLVGYMILVLGAVALVVGVLKLIDITMISFRVNGQRRAVHVPSAGNSLGRLLQTYQDNAHTDSETLEMRLHDRVVKESGRVNRFTVFLAIIAAVAPLMGLLGTVVGMINTFQAITLYGTGDPQTMAGGISQALITTVLGLVVAVPAVLLHTVVAARGKKVIELLRQHMALLLGDRLQEQAREDAAVGA